MGLVVLTGVVAVLYLTSGLRLVGREGSGWRSLDLDALQRRIDAGELQGREADWYHRSTDEETRTIRGLP
jgi:hypothetical protein